MADMRRPCRTGADVGGYDWERHTPTCARSPRWECRSRRRNGARSPPCPAVSKKRVVLESLLRGPGSAPPGRARTTAWTSRAKRWLEETTGRQPERPSCSSATANSGPGRDPDRHLGADRWRQHDLGAPGALRDPRREAGIDPTTGSTSSADSGTRAGRSSRNSWSPCVSGGQVPSDGMASRLQAAGPACASSRGPAPGGPFRCGRERADASAGGHAAKRAIMVEVWLWRPGREDARPL